MKQKAKAVLDRFNTLKSARSNYEKHLEEISDLVLQKPGNFTSKRAPGNYESLKVFNTTACIAQRNLASTLHGGLTNPSSKWFGLQVTDQNLDLPSVRLFIEKATNVLLGIFNSASSGFTTANFEMFDALTSLGTGTMFIEDVPGEGCKFMMVHLSQIYIALDRWGHVDTVYNKFKLTARQAAQVKEWEGTLNSNITRAAEKTPDQEFEFIHCVSPNREYMDGDVGFAFKSEYIDVTHVEVLSEKGYHEMPYIVGRFDVNQCEVYGSGPAHRCLPDIRMVSQIDKEGLTMLQFMARPPMLGSDDGILKPDLKIQPGFMIYGGKDAVTGQDRISLLNMGGNINSLIISVERAEERIKRAFFDDSLISRDGPAITATEAIQRRDERLRNLSPYVERCMQEYLSPLIDRVFGIALRSGMLGEIPNELRGKNLKLGNNYKIEYLSPMARLASLEEAQSVLRWANLIGPLAQVYPEVFDLVNSDRLSSYTADSSGLPQSIRNSLQEIQNIRQQRDQQKNAAQNMALLEASKGVASPIPTQKQ